MRTLTSLAFLLLAVTVTAQTDSGTQLTKRKYSLHAQATLIPQYHFGFHAPYQGDNSLQVKEPILASISATAYLNVHFARHSYLVFNPEAAGGKGLSKTLGIAGFPNGEVYRVGDPKPKPFIARLYIEQRIPLNTEKEWVDDDQNQVAGYTNKNYLSLIAGKFSLTDFFDNSLISHDPRTQFMNWSLMSNGAWDYPANTRGYTMGIVLQAIYQNWAFRSALTTVPIEANGPELQFKPGKAMGIVWELEKANLFRKDDTHFSTLHTGLFLNKARMGNYQQSIQTTAGTTTPDITDSRVYGRTKWGYYFSMDNHFGAVHYFIKTSWNDGNNESWAFTEIDKSLATGFQFDGTWWKRKEDVFGVAIVLNGLSADHHTYLSKGGYGFLIGDGALNYAKEKITEIYYSCKICRHFFLSPDYQLIINPAYNKDRGPVSAVALRLHTEW